MVLHLSTPTTFMLTELRLVIPTRILYPLQSRQGGTNKDMITAMNQNLGTGPIRDKSRHAHQDSLNLNIIALTTIWYSELYILISSMPILRPIQTFSVWHKVYFFISFPLHFSHSTVPNCKSKFSLCIAKRFGFHQYLSIRDFLSSLIFHVSWDKRV